VAGLLTRLEKGGCPIHARALHTACFVSTSTTASAARPTHTRGNCRRHADFGCPPPGTSSDRNFPLLPPHAGGGCPSPRHLLGFRSLPLFQRQEAAEIPRGGEGVACGWPFCRQQA